MIAHSVSVVVSRDAFSVMSMEYFNAVDDDDVDDDDDDDDNDDDDDDDDDDADDR